MFRNQIGESRLTREPKSRRARVTKGDGVPLHLVDRGESPVTEVDRLAEFFMTRADQLPAASDERREIEAALDRYRVLVAGSVPRIG